MEIAGTKSNIDTSNEKPRPLPVNVDGIPDELRERRQWVCWQYRRRDKDGDARWTKVPIHPRTGQLASTRDPSTWGTCDEATESYCRNTWDGMGFVFGSDDPYCGVDLDDAIEPESGNLKPWATAIVQQLDTYTEISPSGTGVKLFLRGQKPKGRCRRVYHDGEVEVYDSGRYFAVTGMLLDGAPGIVQDRQHELEAICRDLFCEPESAAPSRPNGTTDSTEEIIRRACQAKNGEKFRRLWEGDTSEFGGDHSRADQALCCHLAFWCRGDRNRIDQLFRQSGLYRDKWEREDYRKRTIDKAIANDGDAYQGNGHSPPQRPTNNDEKPAPNEAVDDPHRLARLFLRKHVTPAGRAFHFWREEYLRWNKRSYTVVPSKEIRSEVTACVKVEFDSVNLNALAAWEKEPLDAKGKKSPAPVARKVTTKIVNDVMQALNSESLLPSTTRQPAWLGADPGFPAAEAVVFQNGIVHLPAVAAGQRKLHSHTPSLFTMNELDYSFVPDVEPPVKWLEFLEQLWENDRESIDTLQEYFGYALLPDTRQQKIFMIVGPKRSGKGTIARVLRRLVGVDNTCAPSLASLGTNFGLAPLLGKTLATISDARLSGRSDVAVVVERLLSISGEDAQTIDRKNLAHVTTTLAVRFMILTNELPKVNDPSGALVSRLIVLRLTKSWYGKEDKLLTDRILTELPGIFLWAVAGWHRLQKRGYFLQPESGSKLVQDMEDLASPVGAFIRERCIVGPEHKILVRDMFDAWKSWCVQKGRKDSGTEQNFGRDLRAAVPTLDVVRPRNEEGERPRIYTGVNLSHSGW